MAGKIDELDGSSGSSRNKAYAMAQMMREKHLLAQKTNNNEANQLVDKSTADDEQTVGTSSFNDADGSQVIDRSKHVSASSGSESGSDSGTGSGSGGRDQLTTITGLTSSDKAPTLFSFSPAINKIAKRLSALGIEISDHLKKALEKLEDEDPSALKALANKIQGLDRESVKKAIGEATE